MLAPAIEQARVIPNGVDLSIFRPTEKRMAREALGLPPDAVMVLLAAHNRHSTWRDHTMLAGAVRELAVRAPGLRGLLVALGCDPPADGIAGIEVRAVRHQADPRTVARYHQAADLYLHPARADTFPTSILEALACGTPVVATSVGGIPEQVVPAQLEAVRAGNFERLGCSTGLLVPPGDAGSMADAVAALAANPAVRRALGDNAACDARQRFDANGQIDSYLSWYHTIIEDWTRHAQSDGRRAPSRTTREGGVALD